jgi:DNA polymerase III epsilon subunit-like protein
MSCQDHVFVKIEIANRKPDGLAVVRVNRKGERMASFSEHVSVSEPFPELLRRMRSEILSPRYSPEYVVVAHYPEIEREVLRKAMAEKKEEVFEGRMWIAVSQLLWPLVDAQMIPSVSFDVVCAYFGVDRAAGDGLNVEKDCTAMVRVFFELMSRYRTALVVEEGVRDFGGPTLQSFRKVLGF